MVLSHHPADRNCRAADGCTLLLNTEFQGFATEQKTAAVGALSRKEVWEDLGRDTPQALASCHR